MRAMLASLCLLAVPCIVKASGCAPCKLSDEFQCCADKCKCLSAASVCDGVPDCSDGADEANCDCPTGTFRCYDDTLITKDKICDGIENCADGEDERDCPIVCKDGQFTCPSKCINFDQICDDYCDCDNCMDEGFFFCMNNRSCVIDR